MIDFIVDFAIFTSTDICQRELLRPRTGRVEVSIISVATTRHSGGEIVLFNSFLILDTDGSACMANQKSFYDKIEKCALIIVFHLFTAVVDTVVAFHLLAVVAL